MQKLHFKQINQSLFSRTCGTVPLTVVVQDAVFAAALNPRRVGAAVAGCG